MGYGRFEDVIIGPHALANILKRVVVAVDGLVDLGLARRAVNCDVDDLDSFFSGDYLIRTIGTIFIAVNYVCFS